MSDGFMVLSWCFMFLLGFDGVFHVISMAF